MTTLLIILNVLMCNKEHVLCPFKLIYENQVEKNKCNENNPKYID